MRKGWKIYPFEDCLESVPKTTKIPSADYKKEGAYPIVSQEELLVSGYWDDEQALLSITHPVIVFGDHTRVLKYIDFDFVIGADGVKVLSPKVFLSPKFLFYYLKWFNVPSLGYSRHYKLLKEMSVPVPPLAEQESIVAELDLLQGIIDKQKAQLKELDTLAQSIFYDMFGDPVMNDRHWDTARLGSCCTSVSYGTSAPSSAEGEYVYLRMNNITYDGQLDLRDVKYISVSETDFEKYAVKEGDVLFNRTNSADLVGKTTWMHGHKPMIIAGYIIRVRLNERLLPGFVSAFMNTKEMKVVLKAMGKGAVNQSNINSKELQSILTPIPSLPLQQAFATKIEAIERQKASINASIAETRKLFDYTMDKYFG